MLVLSLFISKPFSNGFFSLLALGYYAIWLFMGAVFGVYLWHVLERKHKKEASKHAHT